MSETSTIDNIVSMSINGDAAEVKSAITDALQQKIMIALENKKQDVASSFLTKKEDEEVENG
ncbi:MAG: hypothetical protein HOK72_07580 [Flavobacteriales bacterium]|jgi:hypothetical protein|nr:hypothetical protein [Flavobacteriales bacterium]